MTIAFLLVLLVLGAFSADKKSGWCTCKKHEDAIQQEMMVDNEVAPTSFTCEVCYDEAFLSLKPQSCSHDYCFHCISNRPNRKCYYCRRDVPQDIMDYDPIFHNISDLKKFEYEAAVKFSAKHGNVEIVKALLDHEKKSLLPHDVPGFAEKIEIKCLLQNALQNQNDFIRQLFEAVKSGRLNDLQALSKLYDGAATTDDPRFRNNVGGTLTWTASYLGHKEIVEFLAANGADVNRADDQGRTPIRVATERGNVETVAILAAKGADVNRADDQGRTPIRVATERSNVEIVAILAAKGADVNRADFYGLAPIFIAVNTGHKETIEFLAANGANVNRANDFGNAPIHVATQRGNVETVAILAANGADVNRADFYGLTPIFIAAKNGDVKIVALLIANGAHMNQAVDTYGNAPIHVAAEFGHTETVALLVANGANINQANRMGMAPVHMGAKQGKIETVKFLTAIGADVNRADNEKRTPIDSAQWALGGAQVIRFLLKNKSSKKKRKLKISRKDQTRFLFDKTLNNQEKIFNAVTYGHGDLFAVEYLYHFEDVELNQMHENGAYLVHVAAQHGYTEILKFLAVHGADLNQRDSRGFTPIYMAVSSGHEEIVKFLLKKGVKLENRLLNIETTKKIATALEQSMKWKI